MALSSAASAAAALSFGGSGACGEVVLGLDGQLGLSAGDDEDLFELVKVGRRAKLDKGVGLVVGVGLDGLDGADGRPRGKT